MRFLAPVLLLLALPLEVEAHESRPGYLEMTETGPETFRVAWKVPAIGELRLSMQPIFPENCKPLADPVTYSNGEYYVERYTLSCPGGLPGRNILIDGLSATLTDVLIRIIRLDGSVQTVLLKPASPSFTVNASAGGAQLGTYIRLGIDHILLGIDHLLFVLGLVLLVQGKKLLLKTITAFTVGHTASLALATFGMVRVPAAPLNAAIALSIVFLAMEVLHARAGERFLTARHPWAVSGAFGLLHGLGFATALTELGLPATAIPKALLLFNVGVEIGQILFVAVVLALMASWRKLEVAWPAWVRPLPVYAIGSVAASWFIGRVAVLI